MEDEMIIKLYFDRDEAAISATAKKYGGYCSAIAANILGDPRDTEECVNSTYLKAWEAIPPRRPAVLRTFLGRITRNLSVNLFRRRNTHKRGGGQAGLILEELSECVRGDEPPDSMVERSELAAEINAFLGSLPKEKRVMFVRRYWYADSVTDIAKRMGMTENSVSVSLSRMRSALRKYLSERGHEL